MSPSHQVKQHSSSDHVKVGMEITSTVLRTLEKVSKAAPVPGLSEAAGVALIISETIQKVKGNTEAFNRLGEDACELVYVIYHALKDASWVEDIDPELEANLDDMLKVLLSIQEFVNKGASRKKASAFWRASVDEGQIREFRERLQQCLSKFGLESGINIRFMVFKLASQHEKIIGMLEGKENSVPKDVRVREVGDKQQEGGGHLTPTNGMTDETARNANHNISLGNNVYFSGASGVCIGSNNTVNSAAGRIM